MTPPEQKPEEMSDHALARRVGGGLVLTAIATGALAVGECSAEAYERNPDATIMVEQGDNLWDIAAAETGHQGEALVRDVDEIAHTNHLPNKNVIKPGQRLVISEHKSPSPPPAQHEDIHVIKYGETLWDLVKAHDGHVTASRVYEVAANSGINMGDYRPGQILRFSKNQKPPTPVKEMLAKTTPDVHVTISSSKQTVWALSIFSAAMKGTTQGEELDAIMRANPGMNPKLLKLGDQVKIPGVSQKELTDVIAGIQYVSAMQRPAARSSAQQATNPPQVQRPSTGNVVVDATFGSNNPGQLAQEVLSDPNITILPSPNNRVEQSIANIQDNGATFTHDTGNPNQVPVSPRLLQILEGLAARHHLDISSLTTGNHVQNSDHFSGEAVDLQNNPDSPAVFADLYNNREALGIDDLIWKHPPTNTTTVDNGQPASFDAQTIENHDDHIHFSVKSQDREPLPIPQFPAEKPEANPEVTPDVGQKKEKHTKTSAPAPNAENNVEQAKATPPYTVETNVLSDSGITADQLNAMLTGTGLEGMGQMVKNVSQKYGINELYMVSHAAVESDWGRSDIARDKKNFFGYGAFDNCPYDCAYSFNSPEESLDKWSEYMKRDYLTPGGKFHNGSTISGIFVRYSTAGQDEARLVAQIMNELNEKVPR